MDAAHYSAIEILRDGRNIDICAFKPGDDDDLSAAVGRVSPLSLYRRFFTIKRGFSEREKQFFLNVDFVNHVALMAWTEEVGRHVIVGGGRYVVVQPGKARSHVAVEAANVLQHVQLAGLEKLRGAILDLFLAE